MGTTFTLFTNQIVGKRRFAGFLFLLAFLFTSLVGFSQTYTYTHYCDGGALLARDVLAGAVDGGGNLIADQTGGSWPLKAGLTFSQDNENAIVTGFNHNGGNYYDLRWYANSTTYTIHLYVSTNTPPSLSSFTAVTPPSQDILTCSSPILNVQISNGTANYTVRITDGSVSQDYTLNSGNEDVTVGTPISGGSTYNYQVTYIKDANKCIAAAGANGVPSGTLTYNAHDNVYNVTGSDACAGSATIGLDGSEAGVTYVLKKDGVEVARTTRGASGSFNFPAQSNEGTYTVYATDNNCEITMTGSVKIWPVINTYTASFTPVESSGIYCSSNSYSVGLSGSDDGVTYSLYRDGNLVVSVIGDGNPLFFPAQNQTGTYTVIASNGGVCADVEMNYNPDPLKIEQSPSVFNVTGGTACEDVGVNIALDGAGGESNVTYELFLNGVSQGTRVNDGNFGNQKNTGVYTMTAEATNGCKVNMAGSATVNELPVDQSFQTTGQVCPKGEVALQNSQTGVRYELFRNGASTGLTRSGSSGNSVTFGEQTNTGTYTVVATNTTTGCSTVLGDQLEVLPQPTVYDLTANRTTYCSSASVSGVNLTLSGSDNGVSYQLYKNGTAEGGVRIGDGNTIVWTNVTDGTYTVRASNTGGCDIQMNYSPVITAAPAPTATISAQIPNRRCENIAATFNLIVTLTGTPPFDFDILDDKGNVTVNVVGHTTDSYTLTVNPAVTTTYHVENLSDAASCLPNSGTGTATVYIDPVPVITFNPADPEVCNGSAVTVTAYGAGTGGTYSWSDGLGNNQSISVAPASTHDYSVTATTSLGCSDAKTVTVTVNPLPVVDFYPPGSPAKYEYCENDADVTLTGNPSGGSYSGTGISVGSDEFSPANALVGNNNVTYTYSDTKGCRNSTTKQFVVNEVPNVSINGLSSDYCADAGRDNSISGTPASGTPAGTVGVFEVIGYASGKGVFWDDNGDGTMWFDPALSIATNGAEISYTVRYTYTNLSGCTDFVEATTRVHQDLNNNLSFSGLPSGVCQNDNTNYNLQGEVSGSAVNTGFFTSTGNGLTDGGNNGTATFNPAVAGNGVHTITFTYTDLNGCTGSYSETMTIGTDLSINLNDQYCKGDAAVKIDGKPDGGTVKVTAPDGTVTSGPDNTLDFDPATLAEGTYHVEYTYTDGNGCANSRIWDIVIYPLPDATFEYEKTSGGVEITQYCVSKTSVTLTPVVSGGFFSGTAVSGNIFNPSIAGTGTHNITYTITQNGCTSTNTRTDMSVTPLPTIDINNLDPDYCDNEASFTIHASNYGTPGGTWTFTSTTNALGVSPITDNGDGSAVFDPAVGVGTYTVTMTYIDPAQSCENSVDKTVTIYETPEVNFGGANDLLEFCQDDAPITLTASFVSGGALPVGSGTFSGDGITDHGNGTATFDPAGLTIGDHPITYDYTNPNGCVSTRTKTFRILDYPTKFTVTGGGDFCFVNNPTGLPVGLSDSETGVDYELLLNNLPLSTPAIVHGTGSAISFGDQSVPGVYTVQAVNATSGCSVMMTGSAKIKVNDVTLVVTTTDVSCNGGNDGVAVVTASGGTPAYVYQWEDASGTVVSTSDRADNLTKGTYKITVVDAVGCQAVKSGIVIDEPANPLSVNVINVKDVGCSCSTGSGICEGSAEVSIAGGTAPYAILWSSGGTGTIESDLGPGNYNVTVTDAKGCSSNIPFTISQLPALTIVEDINQHDDNTCHGDNSGRLAVTAGGGSGNYEYSIDNTTWFNTPLFTGLTAGNYDVWVRDASYPRCELKIANPITITEPAALTLSEVPTSHIDVDCNGGATGQLEVHAGGGSGAYEYSINAGANWQSSPVFAGLVKGSYNVWVRDAADTGCEYTGMPAVVIAEPAPLTLSLSSVTDVTCFGEADGIITVTATGGSGNYVYSIDHGANWVPSNSFTGLIAGSYDISVKDASSTACQLIDQVTVTISEPADFTITATHTDVSCFGGNDGTITVTPGQAGRTLEYSIDGGTTWQAGTSFTGLTAGNYKVSVRDVENAPVICTKPDEVSVDIIQPAAALTIDNSVITGVTCNGGSDGAIDIDVSGGTLPYVYQWNDAAGYNLGVNSDNPTGLDADNYTVTVTDAKGCVVTGSYPVTEPAAWDVKYTVTDVSTYGNNDGEIDIHTIGGNTSPYSVSWTDGATDVHRTGLVAGTYGFTITDANGCNITKSNIIVSQPVQLLANVAPSDVTCNGGNDGSILVDITSGTPNYRIDWSGNLVSGGTVNGSVTISNNTYTISSLEAGTYTVDITDASGNTTQSIVTVDQPAPIVVTLASSSDITCSGGNDGAISISVSGGSDPSNTHNYSLTWNGPDGFVKAGLVSAYKDITNLDAPGKYSALVFDTNGCGVSVDFNIAAPAYWDVKYNVTNVSTTGNNDGQIDISTIAGNTSPYQVTWTDDTNNHDLLRTGLTAGTYSFKVEDANGCDTLITNIHVTEPGALLVNVTGNDVDCYGGNDGSIRVEITSGNPDYVISWSGNLESGGAVSGTSNPAPTNLLIDNLEAGTYTINVTDDAGNTFNNTVVISQPVDMVITASTIKDITCNDGADGEIEVSVTGGSGPVPGNYTITWTGPAGFFKTGTVSAEKDQTGLDEAGTYVITVTDNNGCSRSLNVNITAPSNWDVQYNVTHVSTTGNNDGSISITSISGNTSPYIVTWDDDNTNHNLVRTDLTAGTYKFTVADANTCDTVISNIVITEPTPLKISVSANNVSCHAGNDGYLDIAIASGNSPYRINWSGTLTTGGTVSGTIDPANTVEQISGLLAGTYTITATDNVGNVEDTVVTITQPAELVVNTAVSDISCFGNGDGSINVGISGRNATEISNYRMVWYGPHGFYKDGTVATEKMQSNLASKGDYDVIIYDNNNCPLTETYTLVEPDELVVNIVDVKDVTCNGGNDGQISISVSGRPAGNGYVYDWYKWDDASSSWQAYQLSGTTALIDLEAGKYHVEITSTSDGCTVVSPDITIAENGALTLNTVVKSITSCSGDNSGELTIDVSGGVGPFTLDYGDPSDIRSGSGPFVISGLTANTYTVTVTDANLCTVTGTYTITEPDALDVSNVTYNIDCKNDGTGVLNFTISGGSVDASLNHQYYISLTGPDGTRTRNETVASGSSYSVPFNNLPAGSYIFEVQDKLSSSPVTCAYVLNFDLDLISIAGNVSNATCIGVNTGAVTGVTIDGSSGNYTYLWSTTNGQGLDNSTLDQAGLSAGTYNLSITDATRSCTVDTNFVVDNDNTLVITGTVKDVTCAGGSDGAVTNINVTDATPAVSYTWTGPGIVNPATPEQTGLTGGTYQLDVQDANGCATTETFFVNEPSPITFDLELVVESCSPYQRGIKLNNLAGGTGDVNNYQFYWTGPGSASYNTKDLTGLTVGGTYTVTVKDENNCEVTKSITIPEEVEISGNVTSLDCNGANNGAITVVVTGGTGSFSYQWYKDGVAYSTSKDIDNLVAGTYTIEVTDLSEADGSGSCIYSKDIILTEPDPITISGAVKHISCNGNADGEILLTVSGGTGNYSYSWSSGNGTGLVPTAKDQTGLSGGTYTVVVTDDNGCSSSEQFTVLEPDAIAFDLNVTDTQCDGTGGGIQIANVTGGSGSYAYTWAGPGINPSHQNTTAVTGLIAGDYTVTVWDAGPGHTSCHLTKQVALTSAVDLTYSVVPETCAGQGDGAISLDVKGGQPGYTYQWTTTNGTGLVPDAQNQAGLTEGTYNVVVTDARSCQVVQDIDVLRDNVIDVVGAVTDVLCYGENTGAISLTVSGGSGNYSFNWTGSGTGIVNSAEDQSGLSAGSYTVAVTDNVLGCQVTRTFNVAGPAAPVSINIKNVTDVLCKGDASGEIKIEANGGTSPYSYLWSGPGSFTKDSPVQTNLVAGDYNVTVTDANGCMLVSNVIQVTEPADTLTASVVNVVDVSTYGGNDGEIKISVAGGAGAYSIDWSGKDLSGTDTTLTNDITHQTGLQAGNYKVLITDGNSCTVKLDDIFVNQPGGPLNMVVNSYDIIPCKGDDNGRINVNVTGGVLPYTITWYDSGNNQLGQVNASSVSIDNLPAGVYRVDVTDANNVTVSKNDIAITEPALLKLNTTIVQHEDCYLSKIGIIRVNANGGVVDGSGHYRIEVTGPDGYYRSRTDIAPGTDYDFNNLGSGVYNIRLTDDSNGDGTFDVNDDCFLEKALKIDQPEAKVTVSLDSEICTGGSSQIKFVVQNWDVVSNPLTILLSDGSSVMVDHTPYLHTVTPVNTTAYSIDNVSDGSGCDKGFGEGTATVIVDPLPTARIYSDKEICVGETATLYVDLTGAAPWIVTWTDGTTSTVKSGITATPFSFDVTPNDTTTYKVLSVEDVNCTNTGTDSVVVTVNERAGVSISGNADICNGSSANITFSFSAGVAPYNVTLTENGVAKTLTGLIPDASGDYTYTVSPSDTTLYQLQSVTDANGCDQPVAGSVLVTVRQYPQSPGNIRGNDFVCQGASGVSYAIDAVKFATNYVWQLPAGATIVSGGGSDSITVDFDASFAGGPLRVYAENGCGQSAITEKLINVSPLPDAAGAVTGPSDLCQGTAGVMYSVSKITNATAYVWHLPAGFNIVAGDSTSSIIVDLDPTIASLTGVVNVQGLNDCGTGILSADLNVAVTPLPVAFAGNDEEICADNYTLQANAPAAGETGTWTILKGSGVIDPAHINDENAVVTNLSQGENILTWEMKVNATGCSVVDTVVITNNMLTVYASVDKRVTCDGSVTVHGTNVPAGANGGLWSFVSGNGTIVDAQNPTSQIISLDPDTSVVRWTITKHGCQSYDDVEIVNNQPDQAVISNGDSINICGSDITLTANNPVEGTGTWSLVSGAGVIDNLLAVTMNVTGLSKGDNVFRWTIEKNGCSTTDEIVVRNNQLDVDAGGTKTLCDDTYQLNATKPPVNVTGRWIVYVGSGAFDNGSLYNTTVSDLTQGTNKLIWELDQFGCLSRDTVTLINNKPTEAVVGSQLIVCGDTAALVANKPVVGAGYWSVIDGSGRFDDVTNEGTIVRDIQHGTNTYRWTITHEGCSSYDDLVVENMKVDIYAGKDTAICDNKTYLDGSDIPGNLTGEWNIVPGMGSAVFSDRTVPDPLVSGLSLGNNMFVWTITNGICVSRDTVVIANNMPSSVDAGPDKTIFSNATQMSALVPNPGVGMWSLVSGGVNIQNVYDNQTWVTNIRQGVSVLRWTVENMGCVVTDDVVITNGDVRQAFAGRDQTICNDWTILEANDPGMGIGSWSVISGSAVIESLHDSTTKVTNLGPGNNVFAWEIFNGYTSTVDTVVITNNSVSVAKAGPDRELCADTFRLEANVPAIGSAKWTLISGGAIFDDNTLYNTMVRDLAKGANMFKYEISQLGCSSVDTVVIYNNLPTVAEAGVDQTICADSVELHPNNPTFGIGEWRVDEGAGRFEGNWAYHLAPGTNKLLWVITNKNCSSADTILITNDQPSVSFAGQDRVVCADSVMLSASVPHEGKGLWELIDGSGIIADSLDANTPVTKLSKGDNRFRWTITKNSCKSYDDVIISYNIIDATAGHDQINCADTAVLGANLANPGIGTWGVVGGSGSAMFDDNTNPYTVVRELDQGANMLTWTIDYLGCRSVDTIIIVNNNPTKAFAGNNIPLCKNETKLAANIPVIGRGKWTVIEGGASFDDDTLYNTYVDSLKFGDNILRWTISSEDGMCVSYDDVEVSFNRIDAFAGPDLTTCNSDTLLEANSALPGLGTWSVVGGGDNQASFEDQNTPNTRVYNLAQGNNVLRWTVNYRGCETYDDVTVVNNSPSTAYAGNSQEICTQDAVLDATQPAIGTGQWTIIEGSAVIDGVKDPKSTVSGLSKGDNVLRWIVENKGCYSYDDVVITNNRPSVPYAGEDVEVCYDHTVLKASPPDYGTGNWSIITGAGTFSNPNAPDAEITNLAGGENKLLWTLVKGQCKLYDTILVVNNAATVANAGPDVINCVDSVRLDANVPDDGQVGEWSLVSGNTEFVDVNNPKTIARNLGSGKNIFMWAITNGSCFSRDTVVVVNQVPDQAVAGDGYSICGYDAVLNANVPQSGKGTWSVLSGTGDFEDPNRYDTKVTNVGFGENVYRWTITYEDSGCSTSDTIIIKSNKAEAYAGEDAVVYDNEYKMKAANPGSLTGKWSTVAGYGEFDDDSYFATMVRKLNPGNNTFNWSIDVNGCVASDDITITYKVVPDAGFQVDNENGCYPLDVNFTNYSVGGDTFHWDFGDGTTSTERHPVHTYQEAGEFTVILTVPGPDGKDAEYSKAITVYDHPVADFDVKPTTVYIPGEMVRLYDLSVDGKEYLWDFGDGTTSTEQNPSHEYADEGIYSIQLTVQNEYSCRDSLLKEDVVEAKSAGFVTFPNAFMPRPSGDVNDVNAIFKPAYRDVEEYTLQIFNRWGQLLFESNDINVGWNGIYKGKLAPQAVYVWKASGTYISGKEFHKTGSVLLVR